VDEPDLPGLLPRVARATGPLGYVRFHGRNAKSWYAGDGRAAGAKGAGGVKETAAPPKPREREHRLLRYDYLYSETELKEWADKIRDLNAKTQKTFVFFNNCHAGQAATSAKLMRTLLGMPEPHVAEQTGLL
jgi:uncharacterized protein YecE (DUF72 family)